MISILITYPEQSNCYYLKLLTQNEITISVEQPFDVMVQALTQELNPLDSVTLQLQLQNTISSYDTIGPIPANLVSLQAATATKANFIYTFTGNKVYKDYFMLLVSLWARRKLSY